MQIQHSLQTTNIQAQLKVWNLLFYLKQTAKQWAYMPTEFAELSRDLEQIISMRVSVRFRDWLDRSSDCQPMSSSSSDLMKDTIISVQ